MIIFSVIFFVVSSFFSTTNAQYQRYYDVNLSVRKSEIGEKNCSNETNQLLKLCSRSEVKWTTDFWWMREGDLKVLIVDSCKAVTARVYHIIMNYEKRAIFGKGLQRIVCDERNNEGSRTVLMWTKDGLSFFEYSFTAKPGYDTLQFSQFCEKENIYDWQNIPKLTQKVWVTKDIKKSNFFSTLEEDIDIPESQKGLKLFIP